MKTTARTISLSVAALTLLGVGLLHISHSPVTSAPGTPSTSRAAILRASDPSSTTLTAPATTIPAIGSSVALRDPSTVRLALMERLEGTALELRRIPLTGRLDDHLIVPLGDETGAPQLSLTRHSVRGENFRLLIASKADGSLEEVQPPPVRTYNGEILGNTATLVAASMLEEGISAKIYDSAVGTSRIIEPLTAEESQVLGRDIPGTAALHAILTPNAETPAKQCATTEGAAAAPGCCAGRPSGEAGLGENGEMEPTSSTSTNGAPNGSQPEEAPLGSPVKVLQAELGVDVAFSFYKGRFGLSNPATVQRILDDWLNKDYNPSAVSGTLVEHKYGTIVLRTTAAADPYVNDVGEIASPLLSKFRGIWNGNNASFPRPSTTHDVAHLALEQAVGVTGLAYVGVVGTSNRYNLATARSGLGFWRSGTRHEMGHNYSTGHGDGCGEPRFNYADNNQFGYMCGGFHERVNSRESIKMIAHRNSRAAGTFTDLGIAYAPAMVPYCAQDVTTTTANGSPAIVLDVLANDHDANNNNFTIKAIKKKTPDTWIQQATSTELTTTLGGKVKRLIGTGPGGRDQLSYTAPPSGSGGSDELHYQVVDTTGKFGEGYVKITVGSPPKDPYGEYFTTNLRGNSAFEWLGTNLETLPDPLPDDGIPPEIVTIPSSWANGFLDAAGAFTLINTESTFDTFIGDAGAVSSLDGSLTAAPRVSRFALNPSTTQRASRRWTADFDGAVSLDYTAHRLQSTGDGMSVGISHNGTPLKSHTLTNTATHIGGTAQAFVKIGDTLDFTSTAGANADGDWAHTESRIYDRLATRDDPSLLFHYRMDEAVQMGIGAGGNYERRSYVADISGNNHWARTNNIDLGIAWSAGVIGNSIDLDGTDDFVESAASGTGNGATELTIAAWILPKAKLSNAAALSTTGAHFCGIVFSGLSGTTGFPAEFRALGSSLVGPANSMPLDRWTHFVGVWKAGLIQKLYLDGVEVADKAVGVPTGPLSVDKWLLGKDRTQTNRSHKGRMDDVAVWTRAFSATEVQALFEQGAGVPTYSGKTGDERNIADSQLPATFTEMSISAWVRPKTRGANRGIITTNSANTEPLKYFGFTQSGTITGDNQIQLRILGAPLDAPVGSTPLGEWTHAVGVWKSGEIFKIYINGAPTLPPSGVPPSVPTGIGSISGGTLASPAWRIARDRQFGDRNFDGAIADTLVFSRALTDADVVELFKTERTAYDASHGIINKAEAIGTLGLPGSLFEGSGTYTLLSSGTGLAPTADNLQFSALNHRVPNNKGELTARVDSLENTNPEAFAGLMFRESLSPTSAYVSIGVRPDNAIIFRRRATTGADMETVVPPVAGTPGSVFLRIRHDGDSHEAAWSKNGDTWTVMGTTSVSFTAARVAGLAIASGLGTSLATANIGAVTSQPIEPAAPNPDSDADGLADAWEQQFFGNLTATAGGSADADGDGMTDLAEYQSATSPINTAQSLRITNTSVTAGMVTLAWQAVEGKRYRVTRSTDLQGPWTTQVGAIAGRVPESDATFNETALRAFYRIEVENPTQ